MAASLRVYRQRIRSVTSTKKITRAMELIAASRIMKAQQRSKEAAPYARAITRAVSALASFSDVEHPLTTERPQIKRAAMLLVTADRGLAGSYSSAVIREGDRLTERLQEAGTEVVPYLLGRKGVAFYGFRRRHVEASWTGNSDAPEFGVAAEVGRTLVDAFLAGSDEGGVDEINIVFTRFVNMVKQEPTVIRLLPVEVVDDVAAVSNAGGAGPTSGRTELLPLYDFEPDATTVLDALLPQYIQSRIYSAMLSASASELASRQAAMKSATDNASDLIRRLQQQANAARQAAITQEISEIVGGADALAGAGSDS